MRAVAALCGPLMRRTRLATRHFRNAVAGAEPGLARASVIAAPFPSMPTTMAFESSAPTPRAVDYLTGTHAAEAVKQVRDKVGEPFRVLEISVWDDRVTIQAQDPKKPENIDEYRVRGGQLEGPAPVRLFGDTDEKALKA